ncbi:PfkB family carbohydrate kinase [Mycolicibacter sinensis]|uniref:D-beta-D-heptose 1-phosphate adenosyltransferase n=1 Tax=Mycolicibacter sinensis (strain JDM601) TaxID=875328 RepID=A0A1A2XUH3_MYCSD|nr:PfkB family carbohydrate kinase [Mycolicibacter sinensis]OBH18381.1 D-beta-D-heptose 1-phosphate adenosyltransferase [Mycolicibacter sinensis]OBI29395.1 D-beta-D-heptose 1-phosphate adenosyltransferase [Mycolicibacter sinensis]
MKPLVVVGDSMLDVDVDGTASRLSPEAPVPVVDPERIWQRPGGAGLAAVLAAREYGEVVLVTATADDATGRSLARIFAEDHPGIQVVRLPLSGGTLSKIRIRAGGQSVVRVDHGDGYAAEERLPAEVGELFGEAAAICVADYGHGVASHDELRSALTAAAARTTVVWDPHPRGAVPIPRCALATPNDAEAKIFAPSAGGGQRADALRRAWGAGAVSVTLGAGGALFADARHAAHHIRSPGTTGGRSDTCGAGDRFAVAAALALANGADALAAASAAVADASRFVVAGGAAGVSSAMPIPGGIDLSTPGGAVTGMAAVTALAHRVRRRGGTLVATGGCFDLLHTGHVRLLRRARDLGDALVVLINSDDSVRALKGTGRPVVPAEDRARVLAALACVDGVAIFHETSPTAVLERLRPDIWVKGGDYGGVELPEAETVRRHGGQVLVLPTIPGYSSSKLIAAVR